MNRTPVHQDSFSQPLHDARLAPLPTARRTQMAPSNGARVLIGCLVAALSWLAAPPAAAALVSYARVLPDATLVVGSRTVRLYGIFVPPMGRTCRTSLRPVKCGTNAALALEFRIRGFVHCQPVHRHPDRSVTALCRNKGVDLSAYLIERGWAVALPDGPFEYHVLERIARKRNMGVWGMHGVALPPSVALR